MRHRIVGRKLRRKPKHRHAMERNMIAALVKHERIETTLAKAKHLRPIVEKIISLSREKSLAKFRIVRSRIHDLEATRKLFDEIGPRYANRPGGYTRVLRLPGYRIGDGGTKAILELVDNDVLERKLATAAAEDED